MKFERSDMVANILPTDPRPWGWVQNSTFLEYGHVAYQIKGNDACSSMVANILPDPPPSLADPPP